MTTQKGNREGMFSDYRILDLTDHKGMYCAKVLADLGADVIKMRNRVETLPETSALFTKIFLTPRKAFIGGPTIPAKEA